MAERVTWNESIQELLKMVRDNSSVHLSDMEEMLLQIDLLLMQAIEKLGTNVVQIGQDVYHLREVTNQLEKSEVDAKAVVEKMNTLGQEIEGKVAEVVTAMQFQDMTSQLIHKILGRTKGMQEVMERLDKLFIDLSRAEGLGDVQMMVHAIVEDIEQRRKELEAARNPQVSQKHLDEGSVDLF